MRKIILILSLIFLTSPAYAVQELKGTFDDWRVFIYKNNGKNICYLASIPIKKTGNYNKRGEPFILLTHRKSNIDEFSTSSGYPYRKRSKVSAVIDAKNYHMFTKGERAWAYDEKQDREMINSLKRGSSMTIKGTSERGTYSSDGYSLKGFSSAYRYMNKICR